ncbi:Guanosine-3',5'-bis(diphosphate) 3'-pyrophosphohydrolase MESH1 [Blastocladiella emersonii ATCC 22665]|nr:Guanosine-3',5'-bis(diphosphate) 3'-pyrophosphohydrolase MESH1 [Blastocladiella emersonii ATCC 22665]
MATLALYPVLPDDAPVAALLKAAHFAAVKHRFQQRKDGGTPYINHPLGVATLLAAEGGVTDVAVLQAAVLHDTVEDTDTTPDEIREHFGERVALIVAEVTDDKHLPSAERKQKQVETAPHKSHGAQLVKLADKLYNLRDLTRKAPTGWTAQRIQAYFAWSKRVTDGCKHANAQLAAKLDELYEHGEFEFDGVKYKCLPQ